MQTNLTQDRSKLVESLKSSLAATSEVKIKQSLVKFDTIVDDTESKVTRMKKLRDAVLAKVSDFERLRKGFLKLGDENKSFLKESTQKEI